MNIILFEKADEVTFSKGFSLMPVNLQNHKDNAKSSVRTSNNCIRQFIFLAQFITTTGNSAQRTNSHIIDQKRLNAIERENKVIQGT